MEHLDIKNTCILVTYIHFFFRYWKKSSPKYRLVPDKNTKIDLRLVFPWASGIFAISGTETASSTLLMNVTRNTFWQLHLSCSTLGILRQTTFRPGQCTSAAIRFLYLGPDHHKTGITASINSRKNLSGVVIDQGGPLSKGTEIWKQ